MKLRRATISLGVLAILAVAIQCRKDDKSINFFTVNQDIAFGASMDTLIMDDPTQFPLLSKSQYPSAYQHIERIRDNLIASGQVNYADRFPWVVKIIHNDTTLNAFAAPGGYMYFYTGIIHFLEDEAEFAGVMAHEMAHCDRRHSTDNMTKQYGIGIMMGMLLGNNPNQLAEIAAGLASGLSSLAFSRKNEYEADQYAVKYMSGTDYDPRGLAGFFEKLEGHPTPPTFLSTHPSPDDRIEQIYANWELEGSKTGERFAIRYQDFKNSLPTPIN
ncbi:M48 family metalloprotease [Bacteroidota bacterium]